MTVVVVSPFNEVADDNCAALFSVVVNSGLLVIASSEVILLLVSSVVPLSVVGDIATLK